ncbi:DUF7716 domain-containing protein [Symmachiella dynata]|uniref:DUF7716 domain-containing protein n=1 Tax=Symmachiella dynata TaxID=2527995 RepID=UPI003C6EF6B5
MPLTFHNLGFVLSHIYEFPRWCAVYLPTVDRYEADTQCIVAVPTTHSEAEEDKLHHLCLAHGFKNWLNIAVISDTCDDAADQTEPALIAAFNQDCREGEWLWRMMDFRNPDSSPNRTS